MTTMKDITEAGGRCEKVATDFWECTDKNGKVWWCDSTSCQPKPTRVVPKGEVVHITSLMNIYVVPDKSGGYRVVVMPGEAKEK